MSAVRFRRHRAVAARCVIRNTRFFFAAVVVASLAVLFVAPSPANAVTEANTVDGCPVTGSLDSQNRPVTVPTGTGSAYADATKWRFLEYNPGPPEQFAKWEATQTFWFHSEITGAVTTCTWKGIISYPDTKSAPPRSKVSLRDVNADSWTVAKAGSTEQELNKLTICKQAKGGGPDTSTATYIGPKQGPGSGGKAGTTGGGYTQTVAYGTVACHWSFDGKKWTVSSGDFNQAEANKDANKKLYCKLVDDKPNTAADPVTGKPTVKRTTEKLLGGNAIAGKTVRVRETVTYPEITCKYDGLSDDNGKTVYRWETGGSDVTQCYVIQGGAAAPGTGQAPGVPRVTVNTPNTVGGSIVSDQTDKKGTRVQAVKFDDTMCYYSKPKNGAWTASGTPPAGMGGTGADNGEKIDKTFHTENLQILSNWLMFLALLACVIGVLVSSALWALGSKGQNPGQELTGKKGLILCCTAAFFVGALPGMLNWLNHEANAVDTGTGGTGVTGQSPGNLVQNYGGADKGNVIKQNGKN